MNDFHNPVPVAEAAKRDSLKEILEQSPGDAAVSLAERPDEAAAELLSTMNPARALEILECVPLERR